MLLRRGPDEGPLSTGCVVCTVGWRRAGRCVPLRREAGVNQPVGQEEVALARVQDGVGDRAANDGGPAEPDDAQVADLAAHVAPVVLAAVIQMLPLGERLPRRPVRRRVSAAASHLQ